MVFSGLFQSFDDVWNPRRPFETNVERDCLPTFSLTKLSHLNLLFLKFQSIPPCALSQVGDSWPESGNQLNIYLTVCRRGGVGQDSWVTNSFWSLKDKQLNKIILGNVDKNVSHPGVTWQVPPQVIRLPTSSVFVAHGCRKLSVPAVNNAFFTVGGDVTTEKTHTRRKQP